MDELYFGDGIHDLEFDGNDFRWASDCFNLYIFDDSIKEIKFRVYSEITGVITFEFNDKVTNTLINRGHGIITISLPEYCKKLKIKQEYFVPAERLDSNDNRKLSYRIYKVSTKNTFGNYKHYNVKDIEYYDEHVYKQYNILNEEESVAIKKVGEYGEMFLAFNQSNPNGKLNLNINQTSFYSHRSGWNFVLQNLTDLHNENGVLFDGFLENVFSWRKSECIKNNIIPYKQFWIGVLHNPPNMPLWFSDNNAYPQSIIHDPYFKNSLNTCKGLYVLSEYYARFLKHYLPHIPIEVLYHPTEIPNINFSYEKFINNNNKKIVNIGWWLRKLNSIFLLDAPNKVRLMPNNKCRETIIRLTNIERSLFNLKLNTKELNSVELVDHLSNKEYDNLLSENIVFLDLYDTSANNAVIECIARGTPLLINKHPATIEYLGEEYPFYFDNLEEASKKCKDLRLIRDTNEYLMNFDKRKQITIEYFKEQLINSEIYKSI